MHSNALLAIGQINLGEFLSRFFAATVGAIYLAGPVALVLILIGFKLDEKTNPSRYFKYSGDFVKNTGMYSDFLEKKHCREKLNKRDKKRTVLNIISLVSVLILTVFLAALISNVVGNSEFFMNIHGFEILFLYLALIIISLIISLVVSLLIYMLLSAILIKLFNVCRARLGRNHSGARIKSSGEIK